MAHSPRINDHLSQPIIPRRERTLSQYEIEYVFTFFLNANESIFRCERALQSPSYEGTIEEFCREKGHGYIRSRDNPTQLIFAHVSE